MTVDIVIHPRVSISWKAFCESTPKRSIALDGYVIGPPNWDEQSLHASLDHHSDVVREATMSTSMQAYFAVKGGLMERFSGVAHLYINDPDQDTSLATWLLRRYRMFEGVQSHPVVNRLLTLTDRWDITGGAFPTSLDDSVLETHAWVFDPYTNLRVSGALAIADEGMMRNCVDAVHTRLDAVLLGQAGRKPLRHDATILHDSRCGFKIIDETGGNEARFILFSKGMDAFVSRVATRLDGRFVYSIGRRSRYVDFPLRKFYAALNAEEKLPESEGWGGSDIIGGSSRLHGSGLPWETVRDVIEDVFVLEKYL